MKLTMKRRLLAVAALAALAVAQVIPASATYDYMSYGSCFGTGNSTSSTVSSAYTQNTTGGTSCWLYLQMNWYDPIGGTYYPEPALYGMTTGYWYDSIGLNTSLSTYHRVGTGSSNYDPGYTYS